MRRSTSTTVCPFTALPAPPEGGTHSIRTPSTLREDRRAAERDCFGADVPAGTKTACEPVTAAGIMRS